MVGLRSLCSLGGTITLDVFGSPVRAGAAILPDRSILSANVFDMAMGVSFLGK